MAGFPGIFTLSVRYVNSCRKVMRSAMIWHSAAVENIASDHPPTRRNPDGYGLCPLLIAPTWPARLPTNTRSRTDLELSVAPRDRIVFVSSMVTTLVVRLAVLAPLPTQLPTAQMFGERNTAPPSSSI